jgi:hypothetical protein
MNDELADALTAIIRRPEEGEQLRAEAAIALGPVLEQSCQAGATSLGRILGLWLFVRHVEPRPLAPTVATGEAIAHAGPREEDSPWLRRADSNSTSAKASSPKR